jgi:hypothetical protein
MNDRGLLQSRRLGDSDDRFLQLLNYLKSEGLILRR